MDKAKPVCNVSTLTFSPILLSQGETCCGKAFCPFFFFCKRPSHTYKNRLHNSKIIQSHKVVSMEDRRTNTIDLLMGRARELGERSRQPIQPSIERGAELQHRDLDRRTSAITSTISWMASLDDDTFWEVARETTKEMDHINRGLSRIGL